VLNVLAHTWRVDVMGVEHVRALRDRGVAFIFALWHADLLPLLWHHRGASAAVLISTHRDGRYVADAARRWGYGVIDGSSTRGAIGAFRQLVRTLEQGGEVAITPDGPRGPARVAKLGAVAAAQHARAPIVPVAASASAAWHLRSWDGMMIPKPFARVRIAYETPVTVPAGDDARAGGLERLQHGLTLVSERAQC
jgi:lysophospholipid acyltransferase (LPLAT)-like uncharacterized protein